MRGREARRPRCTTGVNPPLTLARVLAGSDAWSAENVSTSGANTTQWNPVSGSATLASVNTQQAAPAASANLNNRLSVTCAGGGHYQGTITPPGLSHTLVMVGRYAGSGTVGFLATTNAGALNSGTSLLAVNTSRYARRLNGNDAIKTGVTAPDSFVHIGVMTAADSTLYYTSRTPVVAAAAQTGFSFGTVALGALSGVSQFPFVGEIGFAAVIPRAITAAEIGFLLTYYGTYYGITIAP